MPVPIQANQDSHDKTSSAWAASIFVDFLGVFCLFFIYAGSSVPAINEPHYWSKAAHFWNPNFGLGDLFLESGDAHWLFFATFGYLTQVLPIVWAVWVGRLICWLLLATGWTVLGRSIWSSSSSFPLVATAFALVWLSGLHWGHWAGEWVVGGCESKGIAYAFIFFGLAMVIQHRWTLAWTLLGIAAAFHVVVGIWVIACTLFVTWVLDRRTSKWFALHRYGWCLCFVGVLVGVVPAISIDWGADPNVATDSAVMQAYRRLGHHLAPTRFSSERWRAFLGMLALTTCLSYVALYSTWSTQKPEFQSKMNLVSRWTNLFQSMSRGMQVIILCAAFAASIALIGWTVDITLSHYFPGFAAKILRFYWFRWNDVAMPMYVAAMVVSFAYSKLVYQPKPQWMITIGWAALFLPGIALLAVRFNENYNEKIPAGDKAHFVTKSDSIEDQVDQYHEWLRVCEWIDSNTDLQGLWLTPRRQQSFKWRTGRPELACWKDAPQNAVALVEWGERLALAYKFEGEKKILQPLSEDRLWELHNKYSIRYVLLDMRVANQKLPSFPVLYPNQNESNACFSVFEFPASRPSVELSPPASE
ncbi:MAG: DUF6798 domain-containing protein, partial [Pirellula sp.]